MKRIKIIFLYILCIIMVALLFSGCSNKKAPVIVSLEYKQDSAGKSSSVDNLYMSDFLYKLHQVETEGNRLEAYYKKNLGISYWDYEYQGSTMREQAKISLLAETVMDEILYDQAVRNHIVLTTAESKANDKKLTKLYASESEQSLDKLGLTKEVITSSLNKLALADKYKSILCKDLNINKVAIRGSIHRSDYSSQAQYEQAVSEAIASETELAFEPIYKTLKTKYNITINYDYWNTIQIGGVE